MSYATPWTGPLNEGIYEVEVPSNVVFGTDTYNFYQWEDSSTNPIRTIDLTADMVIQALFQLQPPPPPEKAYLEVHAFVDAVEVTADGLIVGTGFTFQTPETIEVDPGTYTVRLTYGTVTREYTVDVSEGETIRLDGQLAPPDSLPLFVKVSLVAIPMGIVLLSKAGKGKRG